MSDLDQRIARSKNRLQKFRYTMSAVLAVFGSYSIAKGEYKEAVIPIILSLLWLLLAQEK